MPTRPTSARPATTIAAMLMLAGCAATPANSPGRVERLGEAAEVRATATAQPLSLADIAALGRAGTPPEQIVERIRSTGTRHALTASQVVDLRLQGVDLRVLDHLIEAERQAVWADAAGELAKRDQACAAKLQAEQALCRMPPPVSPFWPMLAPTCLPPMPGYPFWRCM
jgi:hypothetical protein